MLDGRRPGRHPRPGPVQFRARRHLARRFQAVARLGVPPRFRAQRPEHLPHLPHHARRLAALQERSRPARARALRVGSALAARRLRRGALGHGEAPAPHQPGGQPRGSASLRQEIGREFGLLSRVLARALGPVLLWSARREERRLARRPDLRAPHHHRAPQLVSGGAAGPGRGTGCRRRRPAIKRPPTARSESAGS